MFKIIFILLISFKSFSQCITTPNGMWPNFVVSDICTDTWYNLNNSWTGEYSLIQVQQGYTYEFDAYRCLNFFCFSQEDYFVTLADDQGFTIYASALTQVDNYLVWQAPFTGNIRFISHLSSDCTSNNVNSVRRYRCIGQSLNINTLGFEADCEARVLKILYNTYNHLDLEVSQDGVMFSNYITNITEELPIPPYNYIRFKHNGEIIETFFNPCSRPLYYIEGKKLILNKKPQQVRIYDSMGLLVIKTSDKVTDLTFLPSGVYFLQIEERVFKMVISAA